MVMAAQPRVTNNLLCIQTGECLRVFDGFEEPVSCCVWAADGQTFITGSFDKSRPIYQWDLQGNCVHAWPRTHRTEDLALSRDQRWLVAIDEQCNLHVYNAIARELAYSLKLNVRATSISISRDSHYLLVNKADREAVLIDIETRETVRKYTGQVTGQFTIRGDFGGANENFVISGSEGESCPLGLMLWTEFFQNDEPPLTHLSSRRARFHLAQVDGDLGARTRSSPHQL